MVMGLTCKNYNWNDKISGNDSASSHFTSITQNND